MKQKERLILNEMNTRGIRTRLIELKTKHDAIDRAINALERLEGEYRRWEIPEQSGSSGSITLKRGRKASLKRRTHLAQSPHQNARSAQSQKERTGHEKHHAPLDTKSRLFRWVN
jgi:hypothetical protein